MTWKRASLVLLATVVIVLAIVVRDSAVRSGNRFENWLRAVAGAEEDRGWWYLGLDTRAELHQDRAGYIRAAEEADWSEFRWATPETRWTDDGFASVEARLLSAPGTVPAFLFDLRLIHGVCDEGGPVAIGVYEDRRLFHFGGMSGGGLTGSGAACNALFTGERVP